MYHPQTGPLSVTSTLFWPGYFEGQFDWRLEVCLGGRALVWTPQFLCSFSVVTDVICVTVVSCPLGLIEPPTNITCDPPSPKRVGWVGVGLELFLLVELLLVVVVFNIVGFLRFWSFSLSGLGWERGWTSGNRPHVGWLVVVVFEACLQLHSYIWVTPCLNADLIPFPVWPHAGFSPLGLVLDVSLKFLYIF